MGIAHLGPQKSVRSYRERCKSGLPRKHTIGVRKFGLKNVKLERNADNFCREFWKNRAPKIVGKIRHRNLPSKFAGNFPKNRQAKIKTSPPIRSAEPRDQQIAAGTAEKRAIVVHSAEDPRKVLFRKPAPP